MQISETMKIKLNGITADMDLAFSEMTYQYAQACNYISEYIFSHDMNINSNLLSKKLYRTLRSEFGLKSQLAQSAIKTVTARYQTVDTQLKKSPYRFSAVENGRKNITPSEEICSGCRTQSGLPDRRPIWSETETTAL